jgi:hypothetical protein
MPINIFNAKNTEGRIDVARALGSAEIAMYVYDLAPGQSSSPYSRHSETLAQSGALDQRNMDARVAGAAKREKNKPHAASLIRMGS